MRQFPAEYALRYSYLGGLAELSQFVNAVMLAWVASEMSHEFIDDALRDAGTFAQPGLECDATGLGGHELVVGGRLDSTIPEVLCVFARGLATVLTRPEP